MSDSLRVLQVENIGSAALLQAVSELLDRKLSAIQTTPAGYPEFISRQDVADMFGVSLPTVHAWINAGILIPYKIANKTRFIRAEVMAAAKPVQEKKKGGSHA